MNETKRREIFARLQRANPAPRTELNYTSAFELLIAVILSAQATDKGVNKATPDLFGAAPTPAAMAALGVPGVSGYIKSIGLFNGKAKNIVATCEALLARHGGEVPRTREALEALPGVGRKTAKVVLNTAFGEATIAVDTHIFRVANRTGVAPGKTVRAVEDKLMKVVPVEYRQDAHHWLILHGRYACKARAPLCPTCVLQDLCEYRHKNTSGGFMSMFGSYTRDQLRQTYVEAWRKQRASALLTPLEAMIADVLGDHPEYQPVVQDTDRVLSVEPAAGDAPQNPFLHMGLHMAVREQLSIDRPPGIRELRRQLGVRLGDLHRADHALMDALAETLWEAQRRGQPPDESHYLAMARRALGGPPPMPEG